MSQRPDRSNIVLGSARLDPDGPVVAGAVGQWTLVYTVGAYGIDEGGTIKVAHRFASDWEPPQFDRPADPGYTTVRTNGQAKLAARFDRKGHHRPWMKVIVIDVYDGSLAPGDEVVVVLGDRSGGGPGIRAQSFVESRHEVRVFADPTNACQAQTVPNCPAFPIVAGEPQRLVAVAPAQAAVGRAVPIHVRGEDRWGNPTAAPDGVSLRVEGDAEATLSGSSLTATAAGTLWVVAEHGGLVGRSNPVGVSDGLPALRRYWGDLHAQTGATVGTGTEDEYFTFGRDVARLDFTSHQGNDFQMSDEDWQRLNDTVRRFHDDGRFVVFPGYEWSANTTAGGDRNVFYLEEDLPIFRSSPWQLGDREAATLEPVVPATELFARLREVGPDRALSGAHVGGRYADIRQYFDEEVGPLVEIVSCWGVFEWLLHDALDKGYVVGVMCNSDGHKGRPGAEGPGAGEFGIAGGLTCVLARDLTRPAVWEALKQRRCYGTTGARIALDLAVNGEPMGSILHAPGEVEVAASATGVGPMERLQLYRGRELIREAVAYEAAQAGDSRRVRVAWRGSRIRGRGRRVTWDGRIHARGVAIVEAAPFSFDSPADGITGITAEHVAFTSKTTGDSDGIDLRLDRADRGTLTLESAVDEPWVIDLAQLATEPVVRACGGVDMAAWVQRLPERPETMQLQMHTHLAASPDRAALWVKATQIDGQTAWSSPIYLQP